ncbi:unnamed protein product, partial [Rotaria sp. Silwood2]
MNKHFVKLLFNNLSYIIAKHNCLFFKTPLTQVQPSLPSSVAYQREPMIDCSSLRKSTTPIQSKSPPSLSISTDLNPVDIL